MGITIKANQALGFNQDETCNCGGGYCQPIQTDDITQLQGSVGAATGLNLVLNSGFANSDYWTLETGWTISGGKLHATNIASGDTATSTPLGLVAGKIYLVQANIDVTSVGSATTNEGFIIKVNDQALALPGGATAYRTDLVATWLFKAGTITTDVVEFSTNESTIDFDVVSIGVYELSEVGLAVYNGSTLVTSVTSFTGNNSLKYVYNDTLLTSGSIIKEGSYLATSVEVMFQLTINDWASVTGYTGCMLVRIYDTLMLTTRIRNGTFTTNLDYWDAGDHWAQNTGRACYTGDGVTAGTLEQTFYLIGGNIYTFSFVLSGMTLTSTIQVQYTLPSGVELITYTGNSASAREFEIDLSDYTGVQEITVSFQEGGGNPELSFCVDDVICVADEPDSLNESSCINLQTSHACSILFHATNNDNAFGFDYSQSLTHYLRLTAKKDVSGYPEEKETYLFSDNTRLLLGGARRDKEYEVNVTDAPDYIHDCLSMMRLNDSFYIDGSEYVAEGNYDLRKRKSSRLKQSVFTVKDKTGIATNYACD